MAEFVRGFPGPRLVIDHHVSQDDLGAIFIKDTAAEATGTLVLQAVRALGATLTPEIATGPADRRSRWTPAGSGTPNTRPGDAARRRPS